jgi:hypothetical protein
MTNIEYRKSLLYVPPLPAGTKIPVVVDPSGLAETAVVYVVLVDDESQLACAVSTAISAESSWAGSIDLYTDVLAGLFAGLPVAARRWGVAELVDIQNRRSLAMTPATIRNSRLLVGDGGNVPDFGNVLTTTDFAAISAARPATPTQVYDVLAEILTILKGH